MVRLEDSLLLQAKYDIRYEERVKRNNYHRKHTFILGCFLWIKLF